MQHGENVHVCGQTILRIALRDLVCMKELWFACLNKYFCLYNILNKIQVLLRILHYAGALSVHFTVCGAMKTQLTGTKMDDNIGACTISIKLHNLMENKFIVILLCYHLHLDEKQNANSIFEVSLRPKWKYLNKITSFRRIIKTFVITGLYGSH